MSFANSNSFGVFSHSKGFGKNCFRNLYGSVGQIRLGQLKGSAEGSTKILPRFHQGCASFVVSLVFWASSSWAAKRFYGLHGGSAKVPPRFQQGCTKVLQVSWCLWFSFVRGAKRFFGRFPHHFFKLVSQRLYSFLHFSQQR